MSDTGFQERQDAPDIDDVTDTPRAGTPDAQRTSEVQPEGKDDALPGEGVTREEFEAIKARMQAADRRAAQAEQKLEEQARKERTELENAQADLAKAQERIQELETLVNSTAVETEFVKYGKHEWVDVDAALRLLDREGVEVKDGSVSGLGPAIEKLVKSKPYLLKKNNDQNDSSGASGSASNGRRKGSDPGKPQDYSSRFPALKKTVV